MYILSKMTTIHYYRGAYTPNITAEALEDFLFCHRTMLEEDWAIRLFRVTLFLVQRHWIEKLNRSEWRFSDGLLVLQLLLAHKEDKSGGPSGDADQVRQSASFQSWLAAAVQEHTSPYKHPLECQNDAWETPEPHSHHSCWLDYNVVLYVKKKWTETWAYI